MYSAGKAVFSADSHSVALSGLQELPRSVLEQKKVQQISFFSTPGLKMKKLVQQFKGLPSLVSLAFISCDLNRFPGELCELEMIRSLTIAGDSFAAVPASISKLRKLLFLDLGDPLYGGNSIRTLPSSLGELHELRELYLFGNELTEFPAAFSRFPLRTLDLRYNNIPDVSQVMKLTGLIDLDLSYNPVISLSGLEMLTKLQFLNLHSCGLTAGMLSLSTLTALEILRIGENPGLVTEELCSSIANLPRLRMLDLTHAGLTEIPPALGKCKSLEELSLNRNNALNLDQAFRVLEPIASLRDLSLCQSDFKQIPGSVALLQQLKVLYLSGNKLDRDETQKVKRLLPGAKVYS